MPWAPFDGGPFRTVRTFPDLAGDSLRLTPNSGQVVVWSGGLEGRLFGLSGQVLSLIHI